MYDSVREIPLTQGKVALVTELRYGYIRHFKWYAHRSAYNYYAARKVTIRGKKVRIFMHRVISRPKPNEVVHHIDGNSLNNCDDNLVNCTHQQNLRYRKYK